MFIKKLCSLCNNKSLVKIKNFYFCFHCNCKAQPISFELKDETIDCFIKRLHDYENHSEIVKLISFYVCEDYNIEDKIPIHVMESIITCIGLIKYEVDYEINLVKESLLDSTICINKNEILNLRKENDMLKQENLNRKKECIRLRVENNRLNDELEYIRRFELDKVY